MAKKSSLNPNQLLLSELRSVANNLWWSWNLEAQALFHDLSPQLWDRTNHNAVDLLASISEKELLARLGDPLFAARVKSTVKNFHQYMSQKKTWAAVHAKGIKNPIAYFSAEFGFHESVRTYSGGLGILAGDHTKSASDLGLPFIGMSLFYRQGYFEQRIAVDGWQNEHYLSADPARLPLELVVDKKGIPVRCSVLIGYSEVQFVAWKLTVGRSMVFLMDTNLIENEERFRDLTAHVYGGDQTTRIAQEIILGIGGVRFLRTLGVRPAVFHMNEGHSAFLTLELLREQLEKKVDLKKAESLVKAQCVFTTHTPVPAGHDRFNKDLMGYAFSSSESALGIPLETLMQFGRVNRENIQETFCMTVLALRMSRTANGVSELHGTVSRGMWKDLFPNVKTDRVPIGHVTNGVHVGGWLTETTNRFWNRVLGPRWTDNFNAPAFWKKVLSDKIAPDEELWALRYELRRELIEFSRCQLRRQHMRYGNGVSAYDTVLNPDALTIGFSRRFATYKRAPLLFTQIERAIELFNDAQRPVQLIFSGKAHPRDDEGKKYIKKVYELTQHPMLFGKVIFLENYDINVARHLISGADVWLNNPRRPLEASGTSGQKVSIHGGMNCSIMDGWWREAYDGENGWSIGGDESPESADIQDKQDAEFLFEVLKYQVIPEFFDRTKNGIPVRWLKRIRRAIATLVPQYNTHRMVAEYVKKYYA